MHIQYESIRMHQTLEMYFSNHKSTLYSLLIPVRLHRDFVLKIFDSVSVFTAIRLQDNFWTYVNNKRSAVTLPEKFLYNDCIALAISNGQFLDHSILAQ